MADDEFGWKCVRNIGILSTFSIRRVIIDESMVPPRSCFSTLVRVFVPGIES